MRKDRSSAEPDMGSSGSDERRDPSDRPPPPAARAGLEPIRRRTPTIPYGVTHEPDDDDGLHVKLSVPPGIRAKPFSEPTEPPRSLKSPIPASSSDRYEHFTSTVEFMGAKGEESYDLADALAPHLAWLTDEEARRDLFKQLKKGDHGRVLSVMVEERRRYPRNLSIGRAIQIVERAAIARLLGHIGPLELVPQRCGQPTLGRDPMLLFRLVDGRATFEDILRASPFSRLRSLEIFGELVRRRAVKVHDDLLPTSALPSRNLESTAKPCGSMRPRIEAPVPFNDEDIDARATMPDPLEVATRAALLRTAEESERPPKPKAFPSRAPTPEKPVPGRRETERQFTNSGFRPGVNELADPPTPMPRRVAPVVRVDERSDLPERVEVKRPGRRAAVHIAPVGTGALGSTARRVPRDESPIEPSTSITAAVPLVLETLPRVTQRAPVSVSPPPETVKRPSAPVDEKPISERVPDTKRGAERVTIEVAPASLASETTAKSTYQFVSPSVSELTDEPSLSRSSASTPTPPRGSPASLSRLDAATSDVAMNHGAQGARERRLPSGVLGLAAVAVLLSFVAVVIALTRHDAPPIVAQPTPIPTLAPQPTSPTTSAPLSPKGASPDTLRLVVDATPREARVYLDGVLLTGHPINQVLQRDGKSHELRVEAAGYRPRTETFEANEDTKLIVSLELVPPKAQPPPPPPRTEEIYP